MYPNLGIVHRDVLIGCINYHSTPNISDLDLTLRVIASYKERLKTSLPPNVLKQLKYYRDKHIAHRENIAPEEVRDFTVTLAEADSLLTFAKEFLGNIGLSQCSICTIRGRLCSD